MRIVCHRWPDWIGQQCKNRKEHMRGITDKIRPQNAQKIGLNLKLSHIEDTFWHAASRM